jgi:L-ascorbate metabolism protein UlaG (beta-lactamase superfamily)
MNIQLLRHATLIVTIQGNNILVDPMLSHAEAMDPVANAANQRRIPLVDLPISDAELERLIGELDAVLVTHHHRDHWDARAIELLPKDIPILCHPDSQDTIRQAGFSSVMPIADTHEFDGIRFYRTGGHHGMAEIEQKMGTVSGFVLKTDGEPTLYIAGDTIWCSEVQQALQTHRPDVVIVNAGAAQFLTGGPITMTDDNVCRVSRELPSAKVIAVHMEAINHCLLTRDALWTRVSREGLSGRVKIPADGESIRV